MNNGPDPSDPGTASNRPPDLAGAQASLAQQEDAQWEAALRQALRPQAPPAGFTERVMARALAGDRPACVASTAHKGRVLHWPQSRLWLTGAVAAALVAGIFEGGIALHHVQQQQRRIVEATQQFQTTERITVHALAQAREQLQRAGVPLAPE